MARRQIVQTEKAPKAIGPYTQANIVGGFVFTSGQIPLDPETGELAGNNITEQTERVFENLKAVLEAAGSDLSRIVKTTVFLADMDDFTEMNEVYALYFAGNNLPSRSCVQAAALPRGALVEIEAIAEL